MAAESAVERVLVRFDSEGKRNGAPVALALEPDATGLGLLLGIVTGCGLIAAGVSWDERVLLGFGAAALFVFVPWAIFEYLGDSLGAPIALFLAGVALVAVGLAMARLRGALVEEPAKPDDSEK